MRIIATAIDDNPHYIEGLKVFLKSAEMNSPGEHFLVHLTNPPEDLGSTLKKINPNIEIQVRITEEKSAFVRNYIRNELLLELLRNYEQIAWLDNDAIIRKPISGIWEGVNSDTLKIMYRAYYHNVPKKKDRMEVYFQGGVYVVGNGDPVKKWLLAIIEGLKGKDDWYLPQALLYTCWLQDKSLKQLQLSALYNDHLFNPDSYIWHCKNSGFENPKYQKEYQKILSSL